MFLINPLLYFFQLDSSIYLFVGFAFFGVNLLVRKLILHRGI